MKSSLTTLFDLLLILLVSFIVLSAPLKKPPITSDSMLIKYGIVDRSTVGQCIMPVPHIAAKFDQQKIIDSRLVGPEAGVFVIEAGYLIRVPDKVQRITFITFLSARPISLNNLNRADCNSVEIEVSILFRNKELRVRLRPDGHYGDYFEQLSI